MKRKKFYSTLGVISVLDVKSRDIHVNMNIKGSFTGPTVHIKPSVVFLYRQGLFCVCCGLQGTHFCVETHGRGFNLQLYGFSDGVLIKFEKDHIIPKSKGGKAFVNNLQLLCRDCNMAKGNDLISLPDLRLRLGITGEDMRQKLIEPTRKGYYRFQKLSIEEVLPHVGKPIHLFWVEDRLYHVEIQMDSERMKLFTRELNCACCGIQATHFWMEANGGRPHLNLYSLNEDGDQVLMTMDHIIPKSKGGQTVPNNLQLLCTKCNQKKDGQILSLEELREQIAQSRFRVQIRKQA